VAAYNARANASGTTATAVYVIGVKDMYVVTDRQRKAGEFTAHYVFDSAFTFRAAYGR
jgi:hypothetical protein